MHRTSSLFLARSLLLTSSSGGGEGGHVLLQSVGKLFGFEVAIGVNGWIWIKAERPQHVVLIVMALKEMESCEIGYFLPQQQQQKKNDGGDEEEDETTNDNDMDLDKSPPSSSHHDRLKSWEASVRRIVSKLTKQLEEASSTT